MNFLQNVNSSSKNVIIGVNMQIITQVTTTHKRRWAQKRRGRVSENLWAHLCLNYSMLRINIWLPSDRNLWLLISHRALTNLLQHLSFAKQIYLSKISRVFQFCKKKKSVSTLFQVPVIFDPPCAFNFFAQSIRKVFTLIQGVF